MKPSLAVVIACLNENEELLKTIQSIRDTAGDIPVRVTDDCSTVPIYVPPTFGNVTVFRSAYPLGVGPARHVAALRTNADYILITDAHVRFKPGWFKAVSDFYENRPGDGPCTTVLCGQMLALSETNEDMAKHEGVYNGAYMVLENPAEEPRYMFLDCKWATDKPFQDRYKLSGLMGAAYVFPKSFFFEIGGLRFLKGWGVDEEWLSVMTLLCGGTILMFKSMVIGHRFRNRSQAPYTISMRRLYRNKLCLAGVAFGQKQSEHFKELMTRTRNQDVSLAVSDVEGEYGAIACEHHRLKGLFKLNYQQYSELIAEMKS